MSNKSKRNKLIDEYKNIISSLPFQTEEGVPISVSDYYICPLCLETFNLKELGDGVDSVLTLEDVPPKSLGGSPILITCRQCNSSCGHNLDVYLYNEIRYRQEKYSFTKPKNSILTCNNVSVRARLMEKENGEGLKFDIRSNSNNPSLLKDFIRQVELSGPNWKIDATVKTIDFKRNPEAAKIAALKTAYLLAFQKLGYRYILNTNLNCVREQIKKTEVDMLQNKYFIGNINQKYPDGIFLAAFNDFKCIVVIFSLKYSNQISKIAIALPHVEDEECRLYNEDILSKSKSFTVLGPATVVVHKK